MTFAFEYGPLVIALLMAGFIAGFAGGLFGVGGGIVTTPAFYAVFQTLGFDDEISLKTAIGTSLAVIIVTSLRSLAAHHRAGSVDGDMLRAWAPWIAAGAAIGGLAVRWAPAEILAVIFVSGAFYVAWRRLFSRKKAPPAPLNLMRKRMKIPLGLGTGLFSSLMGIGGGALGVMVMTLSGRSMHQAIATSAGFGVAVAAPAVIGFIISGWGLAGTPFSSIGYVNIAAFTATALTAGFAAPLGARAAHRLNADILSKIFGVYVLIAAASLAWDIFWG
ncbi:sulfite exporter TauE/SafE family protein [Hyphococcus sp.]|uniref:sulfite exporter TauE/SafE family protein n=1 Tax=Hyphococcus sp. TaxID=2038636 RepID=UPI003CCBBA1A